MERGRKAFHRRDGPVARLPARCRAGRADPRPRTRHRRSQSGNAREGRMSMLARAKTTEAPISSERWDDAMFDVERAKVLATWPTGAEVDLDEAVAFHKSRDPLTNVPNKRKW